MTLEELATKVDGLNSAVEKASSGASTGLALGAIAIILVIILILVLLRFRKRETAQEPSKDGI